jgi:uncharacterized membrane protein
MRTFIASGAAAALALLLATPALARTDSKAEAGTEQSGSGAATAADERKVCKVLEMTGARTKNKRVCLTREEWRKIDDAD